MSQIAPSTLWERIVQEQMRGGLSVPIREEFFSASVDRVRLVRRGFRMPGGENRAAALALFRHMSLEEQQELFPDLVQLARAAHGPVGAVREAIRSLPREWVLARIDGEVETILQAEEYDDYWMFLELLEQLDQRRACMLAQRASAHSDPEIRELGLLHRERLGQDAAK